MKTYNRVLIDRARSMRKEMTPAEKHLWFDCLCNLPVKFRRQRPFGAFIVDFYCPALKLVIEVDGDRHFSEQGLAYDRERTQFLESLGLAVVRFTNHEVLHQLEGVCERIREYVDSRLLKTDPPCSLREPSPPIGGPIRGRRNKVRPGRQRSSPL
jgi:very-short-patch-repair endonuclease